MDMSAGAVRMAGVVVVIMRVIVVMCVSHASSIASLHVDTITDSITLAL
jgi:hypothetical protein